jgi:hypothetical protein
VPAGYAPIFRVTFPPWSRYSALTAYDINALPIASLNSREVGADPRVDRPDGDEGPVVVNLMGGAAQKAWKGPLCILFRVYRPLDMVVCPHELLPEAIFVDAEGVSRLGQGQGSGLWDEARTDPSCRPLRQATQAEALEKGRSLGVSFTRMISSKVSGWGVYSYDFLLLPSTSYYS